MAKKNKLSTPAWIIEGFDSEADYNKSKGIGEEKKKLSKTFKIRECPECGSDDVGVAISGSDSLRDDSGEPSEEASGTGQEWQCRKCKWKGKDIVEKELTENEFMKYLDEKGEEVA